MSQHSNVLEVLAEEAMKNEPVSGARLAAGIVHRNRMIAMGYNSYKSSPFQQRFGTTPENIFYHAEVAAIKRALHSCYVYRLESSTLYVCRITKDGKWALAKPCEGCASCVQAFGIPRVVYTTGDGEYKVDEG